MVSAADHDSSVRPVSALVSTVALARMFWARVISQSVVAEGATVAVGACCLLSVSVRAAVLCGLTGAPHQYRDQHERGCGDGNGEVDAGAVEDDRSAEK